MHLLLTPAIAFIIILLAFLALSFIFSRLSIRGNKPTNEATQSYACGEDNYNNLLQPDYSNFFPFAFFFTLAHVATLIVTTIPAETTKSFVMAGIYIFSAIIGLFMLFRK